jgi:hypothetical protein
MSTTEDLLDEILNVSMEIGGDVPGRHFPRLFEYPWVLDQILRTENVHRVADIGAGVSPLPLVLAKRGIEVHTYDASTTRLDWKIPAIWSNWGFLDYSSKNPGIKSFNEYFRLVDPSIKYDVIYSVSAIEHTTKSARVGIWNESAKALPQHGRLVCTIDLVRYSNNIWNHSLGRIVEPNEIHGRISDVYRELEDAGFAVETREVLRGLPMSRVDLLFFVARPAC